MFSQHRRASFLVLPAFVTLLASACGEGARDGDSQEETGGSSGAGNASGAGSGNASGAMNGGASGTFGGGAGGAGIAGNAAAAGVGDVAGAGSGGGGSATGGFGGGGGTGGDQGGASGSGGAGGLGAAGAGGVGASGGRGGQGGTAGKGGAGAGGAAGAGGKGGAGAGGKAGSGGKGGAGGGTGGSGGGTTCSVAPINPNATTQARKLLCYLYSQYGNHVISGQQETSWSNPANDPNWINQNTGKYPAILGGDYLYPSGTTSRAQAYWNAGGITMIRYHMGAPPNSDTYENSMGTANIASVLTEGSAANVSFKSKLDYAARELQTLENANVAVLWAPFHEAQPNGWFWWSKGTGAEFVQLWTYMYNYFTTTKGLNNLVWLMPFSGSPNASFYPGRNYVDIAGPDTYATNQPFTSMFTTTRTIVGTTIPIPLHENGLLPNPNDMFNNNAAPWVLFNTWAGYQISNNSLSHVQSVYANTRTVTRDEVPNLR